MGERINIFIRIIPTVNSLLLIYLYSMLPFHFRLIDLAKFEIGFSIMSTIYTIKTIFTLLIVAIIIFILNCIEVFRLMLINKALFLFIEYILVFLFFQEFLFTSLYIILSIISIKFVQLLTNFSRSSKTLNEEVKNIPTDYVKIDREIFLGFLMISTGMVLAINILLSFVIEINMMSILSYVLITIIVLIRKRRTILMNMRLQLFYFIMSAVPPLGILSFLYS